MTTMQLPDTRKMADTRNMTVVHSAMRRDLVRMRTVLAEPSADSSTRRKRLGSHVTWFIDFLLHHERAEDTWLWPVFRTRGGEAAGLAARLEAQHRDMAPVITRLEHNAVSYAIGRTTPAELATDVRALESTLAPHLALEDSEAVPLAARLITRKEWMTFEKQGALKGRSLHELGIGGNFILDGTTDEQRRQLLQGVPRLVRLLTFDRYAKEYQAERDALWGGTAALQVPSLSAEDLENWKG